MLGESELDLSGGSADHREIYCTITVDPIYNSTALSESDSDDD
jgi:hypothetical protein